MTEGNLLHVTLHYRRMSSLGCGGAHHGLEAGSLGGGAQLVAVREGAHAHRPVHPRLELLAHRGGADLAARQFAKDIAVETR